MKTIIGNNCLVGNMYYDLGIQFNTPTIKLLIPPRDFVKFANNFDYYIHLDVIEYTDLSEDHKHQMEEIWNCPYEDIPNFVKGLCGDVLIIFQHYDTFEDALIRWNRRRERINYEDIQFVFYSINERYNECIDRLNNCICLTENYDYPGANRVDVPEDKIFVNFDENGKRYFEQGITKEELLKDENTKDNNNTNIN